MKPQGNFIQVSTRLQPPRPFLPFPLYLDTVLLQASFVKLWLHRKFNVVGVWRLLIVIVSRVEEAKETLRRAGIGWVCHLLQLVLNNWFTFSSPGPVSESCQFRRETFRDTPVHLEGRIIWTKTVEGLKGPGTGRGKKKNLFSFFPPIFFWTHWRGVQKWNTVLEKNGLGPAAAILENYGIDNETDLLVLDQDDFSKLASRGLKPLYAKKLERWCGSVRERV